MRKTMWLLIILVLSTTVFGCYAEPSGETTPLPSTEAEVPVFVLEQENVYFEVAVLGNMIAYPMVKTFYDQPKFSDETIFTYKTYHTESQLRRDFSEHKIDVGIVSFNTAYQLLEQGLEYQLAGILTYEFPVLVGREPLDTMARLKGKNIHINAAHEYFLNAFLSAHDIKTSEVNIIVWAEEDAMITAYNASSNSFCLMSEPYRARFESMQSGNHYDFTLEPYITETLGLEKGLPMGVMLIRASTGTYYSQVMQYFIDELRDSIEWIKRYPEAAGGFAEQFELTPSTNQFIEDISHMTILFDTALEAEPTLERYMTWFHEQLLGGVDPKQLSEWLFNEVNNHDPGTN